MSVHTHRERKEVEIEKRKRDREKGRERAKTALDCKEQVCRIDMVIRHRGTKFHLVSGQNLSQM